MIKISKQKVLATTTLLAILLITSTCVALMPSAHAKEITNTAKGLTIINQVAGIDLITKYHATTSLDVDGSYLGVLPTENIRYTITGFGNTIEIQDTFINGHLLMMTVLEDQRSTQVPALPAEGASNFDMSHVIVQIAKTFLLNYQSYSTSSFYGHLASTLDNVGTIKNSTKTIGNVNFEINTISGNSTFENTVTFTWSYTANGVDAHCKCISLCYKNGFLYRFFDSWNLYPIGSTNIILSQQQAENIAIENAETFTWTIGSASDKHVINNFNITKPMYSHLVFCPVGNGTNSRSSNPLMLYPMWIIGVGLDKFYPGNVYGIYVNIWADNGRISNIQEASSSLDPPAGATVASMAESSIPTTNNETPDAAVSLNVFSGVWVFAALGGFMVFSVLVWFNRKMSLSHLLRLPKLRRLGRAILCILIGSSMLLALVSAIPSVNAGSGLIWGNNSDGSNNTLYHTPNEIGNQSMIASYLYNLFQSCGYSYPCNAQGTQTTPSSFQSIYQTAYYNYAPIATVWFDHGVGLTNVIPDYDDEFHFMLCGSTAIENNPSGDLFDYWIYNLTSTSKNYFCYISTCMSASTSTYSPIPPYGPLGNTDETYGYNNGTSCSGNIVGMPFAWTHGASMSAYGYAYPDSGAYCYVGFPWGSAALGMHISSIESELSKCLLW